MMKKGLINNFDNLNESSLKSEQYYEGAIAISYLSEVISLRSYIKNANIS